MLLSMQQSVQQWLVREVEASLRQWLLRNSAGTTSVSSYISCCRFMWCYSCYSSRTAAEQQQKHMEDGSDIARWQNSSSRFCFAYISSASNSAKRAVMAREGGGLTFASVAAKEQLVQQQQQQQQQQQL
jgi:hypothetical protein